MEASPLLKRRKLNEDALKRPFKSPLRVSSAQASVQKSHVSSPFATGRANITNHVTATPSKERPCDSKDQASSETLLDNLSTPLHPLPSFQHQARTPLSTHTSSLQSTPTTLEIQSLSRQIREMERAALKLRQESDTLTQALRLASSDRDTELDALAIKWRAAARQAAEEMFGVVSERVEKMGGVRVWRDRERRRMERGRRGWEEEERARRVDDDDEDEDGEGEGRDERGIVVEEEWAYDAQVRREEEMRLKREFESGLDDNFTIDLMLKMFNIPLETIGYDAKGHKWIG